MPLPRGGFSWGRGGRAAGVHPIHPPPPIRWHNRPRGKDRPRAVRGRWKGRGPREGQRMAMGQQAPPAADENNTPNATCQPHPPSGGAEVLAVPKKRFDWLKAQKKSWPNLLKERGGGEVGPRAGGGGGGLPPSSPLSGGAELFKGALPPEGGSLTNGASALGPILRIPNKRSPSHSPPPPPPRGPCGSSSAPRALIPRDAQRRLRRRTRRNRTTSRASRGGASAARRRSAARRPGA